MKPLRLWPGIAVAIIQLLLIVMAPLVSADGAMIALLGGAVCSLLLIIWWMFVSRAPWLERIAAMALVAAAVYVAKFTVDLSVAGAGQGFLVYILALQPMMLALVAWAYATRHSAPSIRRLALVATVLIAFVPINIWRTSGIGGGGGLNAHWRWTPTPEELLLAKGEDQPKPLPSASARPESGELRRDLAEAASGREGGPPPAAPVTPKAQPAAVAPVPVVDDRAAEWPGFRGPNRDGVIRGVQIKTDWSASPPVELWRRPVGPGWSSFSVRGDVFYTQEQRGDDEIVAAYRLSTGEPVWRHRDPIRFYESNGGAGPRATPTIHQDRVYAHGATGMLNALDANTGKVIWSHNTAADTGREVPFWGISSSPLIVDDVVIVSVYGTLTGYDLATGKPRWVGPVHGGSYSSPHLLTADGITQVVILSAPGVVSVNPADGKLLWEHRWEGGAIVQPNFTDDGDILINAMSATGGLGTRRLAITRNGSAWTVEERWTTNGLKPYFSDFVIHKGHAYGFDGSILSCIDLSDGKRKWKGGRYGNGQMVLLADQDVLLVISEDGELALVSTTTDQYKEIAKFPALNAKTWNHPVLIGDRLLIRNGEEMASFRLPLAERATTDAPAPPR